MMADRPERHVCQFTEHPSGATLPCTKCLERASDVVDDLRRRLDAAETILLRGHGGLAPLTLYHWAPSEIRDSIMAEGLQPFRPGETSPEEFLGPLCFGLTPASARSLCLGRRGARDLWSVRADSLLDIEARFERDLIGNPYILEVRTSFGIGPENIMMIATMEA